mgnify:CR=1 FL=1
MGDDTILAVENLSVRYGSALILDRVALELARGQLASLIGPNGAGKSTLLKAVAGLITPDSGRIDCRARRFGYVPQHSGIDRQLPMTVGEFLALKHHRNRAPGTPADCRDTLAEVGAAHLAKRKLGQLSGGEFQRMLVAFALLDQPDLLLLDEPLTGVDFRGGMTFHRLLHHLHDERRLSVLMVSHDMHLVEHMSEQIFCLNQVGCCHGPPASVLTSENLEHVYGHDRHPA